MITIELSAVTSDIKILDAVKILHKSGRSAIVVQSQPEAGVVVVSELLAALRTGGNVDVGWCLDYVRAKRKWASQETSRRVTRGTQTHIAFPQAGGVLMLPHDDPVFGATLPADADYHVVRVAGAKADVEARHEWVGGALLARATLCYCSVDDTHVYEPYEVKKDGYCNCDDQPLNCS